MCRGQGVVLLQSPRSKVRDGAANQSRDHVRLLEGDREGSIGGSEGIPCGDEEDFGVLSRKSSQGQEDGEDWVLCRVFYKSRGMSTKPSMETSHDDSSPHSLPALMDNYITLDQTPLNLEGFEQVPCFSSTAPNLVPHLPPVERDMPLPRCLAQTGGLPDPSSGLNHLTGDRKVLRSVLNNLTKLEDDPKGEVVPNFGEGSLGAYLTQSSLASTWNPF
ncbi:hypothetical protein C4D60_Mb09t22470 [Musa balbisiana]|uniref:NAC domain-containing protein n=1 Tax=Musa balbisiana TaxID=52838 RepID=A0A4S8IIC9_MUSBA|nr:hypothetical protein C4D60_Mb09t22470 [Musa balbisiana]